MKKSQNIFLNKKEKHKNILSHKINTRFSISKLNKKFTFSKYKIIKRIYSLNKYIFIIIAILVSYLLLTQNLFKNQTDQEINALINTDRSYTNETIYEAVDKAMNFVNLTNRKILYHKIPEKINDPPKLSIVIPCYNCRKYIERTIRSAQNQNMTDFELIVVNDASKDSTLKAVEELAKDDKRIKIINNKKNMGTLYTRSTGVLFSKGKYNIHLDSDDMFLNSDIFEILYNDIEKSKTDTINYRAISIWNMNDFFAKRNLAITRSYKCSYIMYQPKLSLYGRYRCNLWAQMIKTEVYKHALNLYGEERIKNHVVFLEDCIVHNIIYQVASSSKFLLKFGYLHINRFSSISNSENKFDKAKYNMYRLESLYEFSKYAPGSKDSTIRELNQLIRRGRFQIVLRDEAIRKYLKSLVKRIYHDNDKSISNITKEILLNTSLDIKIINSTKEIVVL